MSIKTKILIAALIAVIILCSIAAQAKQQVYNYEIPENIGSDTFIELEFIPQTDEYPTGCESISTVMALRHAGFDITPREFIDAYLEKGPLPYEQDGILYGPDPNMVFVGDPYSSDGYGCYSPVIMSALNKYLAGSSKKAYDVGGESVASLCKKYVDNSIPVIIWATGSMKQPEQKRSWILPDGRQFTWQTHEHCLVLAGSDDSWYWFYDPQKGICKYEKSLVEQRYSELGSQAIVIR